MSTRLFPIDLPAVGAFEPLAEMLNVHLAARAVIHEATPGRVYADDPLHPRAALIQAHHRLYIAGEPSEGVLEGLRALFDEEIYPRGLAEGQTAYGLYFADGWEAPIREVVLRGRDPIPGMRQAYEMAPEDCGLTDWRAAVPAELEMVEVSRALLDDPRLENIEDLREEMCSERSTVDEFLERSFGVCLRSEREIVTWCLSEYNLGARCEVGIATHPDYRQRGLAAASGAAFLALAQSRGIRRTGWHCWADNLGSVRTALRLGFRKAADYASLEGFFDPALNLAVNGHVCLERGEYAEAAAWLERALALESPPVWAYVASACASARLGEDARAFERLEEALRKGYNNREYLESNEHLAGLREMPEWGRLWE